LASIGLVSTYIHHHIAVRATTSSDMNRHSSTFKTATVLKEWTQEELRSVIRFYEKKVDLLKFIVSW
jgi:hypothetical protein